jgi:hypothetical protein
MDSDIFVILTHCQFEKNNFQNRFNLNDKWYTMSVNKGLDPINTKKYLNHKGDWDRIKKGLPEYKDILPLFDSCISDNLSETNINIILKITEILNIKTDIKFDYPTDLKSTERLVDVCNTYNADTYLSGISGKNYLDVNLFGNINVLYQNEINMVKKPVLEIIKSKI